MKKTALIEEVATALFEAESTGTEVDKFTTVYSELDAKLAYQISERLIEIKCETGQTRIVGRKLGLTSEAKMKQMNVDEPCYGTLLANMACTENEPISLANLIHPKIEPEIAFIFNRSLEGPHITVPQVLEAASYITPALEIIDSRYRHFSFTLSDVIADNASSSRYIIGDQFFKPTEFNLALMGMVFKKNGKIVSTGTGAAVMGHPARAIAWLANKLSQSGKTIQAGDVVLSGALAGAIDIQPNDHVSVSFDGIGSVSASFCP